jgi:DNA (cytosine-5)-methyltransferase 1
VADRREVFVSGGQGAWSVVDLFSGAGGMSYGFHAHPRFTVAGAVDVEVGKPSTGHRALECNTTYEANVGVRPLAVDLAIVDSGELVERLGVSPGDIEVLLACPPCTGFSRAVANNHLRDDPRNSLVARVAEFAKSLRPAVIVMENARELLTGRFRRHFESLEGVLSRNGYTVRAEVEMLSTFGLPQQRERALLIAVRDPSHLRTLPMLWDGLRVNPKATHVRRAIWHLPEIGSGETHSDDPAHTATGLRQGLSLERIRAIPHDGGSWSDLLGDPLTERFLIPAMWRAVERGRLNQHCDVYGRMAWDKPAPTIKRESAHPGNGRYVHPEQDRLCSVREMALLQGFPEIYNFISRSRKNAYRHIGDAVPPLISHQLAWVVDWMRTGTRPSPDEFVLSGTSLSPSDIEPV